MTLPIPPCLLPVPSAGSKGGTVSTCTSPEAASTMLSIVVRFPVGPVSFSRFPPSKEGEEWIVPELTVSPMGWSWSLWICQSLHEQLAREAGTDSNYCILDRNPCQPLEPSNTKHALYIDNFLFLGRNAESVGSDCDRHSHHLRNNGHEIHEDFGPCTEATFSSLDFNWQRNVARVGSRRSWRLRLELD